MATGTIKTVTDRGFGFITVPGQADVFYHESECNNQFDSLKPGQAVEFEIIKGDKGPKAKNVVALAA